jgi:hypothetical protein
MSDDYHDDDEPGGLWDPDAFTPRPAPIRPALYVVEPVPADRLGRRVDATSVEEEADPEKLVRLAQFRTASDGHPAPGRQATRPILRGAAAAGILPGSWRPRQSRTAL